MTRQAPAIIEITAASSRRAHVGGKAMGLTKLMRAGLPVPPTFCVTADNFDGLLQQLIPQAADLEDLRAQIMAAELPAALAQALRALLGRSGVESWAVRSSAIAEDGATHSMAGQQATVLHVSGEQAMHQAIKRVWASLFAQDALLYRAEFEVLQDVPAGIAVLLQPMLSPVCAGVLFTSNPLGPDDEAVISATPGLGTQVVDGRGEETTHFIERSTFYERRRSQEGSPLDAEQLRQLTWLAERTERIFGRPQDIEWAYTRQDEEEPPRLQLLQMRPVTTRKEQASARSVWTNANVGEALPGVGSPMTWSIIHRFSSRGFERAFKSLGLSVPEDARLVSGFRGRVYLNLTEFMSIASQIPLMRPEALFSVAGGGGAKLVKGGYERRSAREFIKNLPLTVPRIIASHLAMPLLTPWWEAYFSRQREAFFLRDLDRLNHAEFTRQLHELDALFERNGLIMLAASSNFLMSYLVMRETLRVLGGSKALVHERLLVSDLDVKSAEPGLALLELGRLARRSLRLRKLILGTPPAQTLEALEAQQDRPDVATFLAEVHQFRELYGHRAPREAELITPRWREDATFIFEVVRGFVASPDLPGERKAARERAERELQAEHVLSEYFGTLTRPLFVTLLNYTRGGARMRESLRALVVESLDMYRRYYLACGKRLEQSGFLSAAQDVFFLRDEEIEQWLEDPDEARHFSLRVLVRRTIHEQQCLQPDPPNTFVLADRKIVDEQDASALDEFSPGAPVGALTLKGLPGSAGKRTGIARVLAHPGEDCQLKHGEVLVVPYADVGWTPLFLSASAVVMGLGGPLSHACIVAREFGVPAVVNAQGAAQLIKTGDRVTVDGDRGVVFYTPS